MVKEGKAPVFSKRIEQGTNSWARLVEREELALYQLLEGLRILDLTRLLPGGFATQMMADLGADVLKVEDPWQGDYMRWLPPHFQGTEESSLFWGLNRNKRSMKLNLKSEAGQKLLLQLAAQYDVVIEGFRPGVMAGLGLGYEQLQKNNPALIMCSISGYGQDGPYRQRAAHDLNFTALAGVLNLTGQAAGAPVVPAVQIGDLGGGALTAVIGVLTAYIARQKTGQGQYVDVSMLDGTLSWMTMMLMEQAVKGADAMKRGKMMLTGGEISYNIYQTRDGKYMALAALETKFWEEFCRLVDREDLLEQHFSRDPAIKREMEAIFLTKTQAEWVKLLEDRDLCCEPVLTLAEAKEHPQIKARQLFQPLAHPVAGPVEVLDTPLKFAGVPRQQPVAPPTHGEHTETVLREELGLGDAAIQELVRQGVI